MRGTIPRSKERLFFCGSKASLGGVPHPHDQRKTDHPSLSKQQPIISH